MGVLALQLNQTPWGLKMTMMTVAQIGRRVSNIYSVKLGTSTHT